MNLKRLSTVGLLCVSLISASLASAHPLHDTHMGGNNKNPKIEKTQPGNKVDSREDHPMYESHMGGNNKNSMAKKGQSGKSVQSKDEHPMNDSGLKDRS
jgi:hypothetical protein